MRPTSVRLTPFIQAAYGSLEDLLDFCRRLPKVELHAHLNGSIPPAALKDLALRKLGQRLHKDDAAQEALNVLNALDEVECTGLTFGICVRFFPLFPAIYALTNDEESLTFIAHSVIDGFKNDGVRYLEVRSGPRDAPETGMTKETYIQTLLKAFGSASCDDILVKLIVAIDRKQTKDGAEGVIDLALKHRDEGIVGVDLCGDPSYGHFDNVAKDAMRKAKSAGLKVTIHLGEVDGRHDESLSMLSIPPDRLGHATYMSDEVRQRVYQERIPIEICMTSNVLTKTVPSYEEHHLGDALREDHPSVLCTDDVGIMRSTLSNEYAIAASTFDLGKKQLFDLSFRAIDACFATEDEKLALQSTWFAWARKEKIL
ncbi:uncharacterized protein EV422DRAFT_497052 [Fimicolochytrium jonesii]|uniref:uncharacterized protein n=1 Tax=Fimicolochytrium jonesii TaxID=1396493 RepID=UPI0022FE3552|nr:uncharacterized protein EV422DRAFT_497052 [Fimicolochytrium jonesii]KAI8820215.1 hypothetical protein EV422DRAFT_497052 [Fimicolochytrium jonesii]